MIPATSLITATKMFAAPAMSTVRRVDQRAELEVIRCQPEAFTLVRKAWSPSSLGENATRSAYPQPGGQHGRCGIRPLGGVHRGRGWGCLRHIQVARLARSRDRVPLGHPVAFRVSVLEREPVSKAAAARPDDPLLRR